MAIHLTGEEFERKHGRKIYPGGDRETRCPSDEHQLIYSNCRNEDVQLLKCLMATGGREILSW